MSDERTIEFKGTWYHLIGWYLYAIFLTMLIIPGAWGAAKFYSWVVRNISFSDETKATFTGNAKDIWGYFVAIIVVAILPQLTNLMEDKTSALYLSIAFPFLIIPLTVFLNLKIINWVISNIGLSTGSKLNFKGKYMPLLGWLLLMTVSIYTIIGWAWVVTAMIRWMCKNIQSENHQLEFVGSGWGLLWRSIVGLFGCSLIVPVPWMILWLMKWYLGNTKIIKLQS